MNIVSAKESERRWKILKEHNSSQTPSNTRKAANDPFDCSDLILPPSQALVDSTINNAIQQWKELEQRRIVAPPPLDNNNNNNKRKRSSSSRDHSHHIRLPEHFDYANRLPEPPPSSLSNNDDDLVMSLQDTSIHLSYESELWKVFGRVPTVEELERQTIEGAACHKMQCLHKEMLKWTLTHGGRMDCHGTSRLRARDCHDLPRWSSDSGATINTTATSTIRMEVWKRQLKRGASPDASRLELEFHGTQTLQDVHDAIVEHAKDNLWQDNDNDASNATSASYSSSSGVFMIEGTFYKSGEVDYSTPILAWLDGTTTVTETGDETATVQPPRKSFLGLPVDSKHMDQVQSMSSVQLQDVPFRLGVRYFHSCHGDVETAIFVTDIRHAPIVSNKIQFPIVHDVWSPSYSVPFCDACRYNVAVYSTSSDSELTDGGPRALCESCRAQLYPSSDESTNGHSDMVKYNVWREQVDLSVGHQAPGILFRDNPNGR